MLRLDCAGLSPRVRGNLGVSNARLIPFGSIPACAGEPESRRTCPSLQRVYPRVCGGTSSCTVPFSFGMGLSPRVRGNPVLERSSVLEGGSIPACAGEPNPQTLEQIRIKVYPRVCGGTTRRGWAVFRPDGLSPRVRGNPARNTGHKPDIGSIPACAGEPYHHLWGGAIGMVYPRVCGGTERMPVALSYARGLSPRVRGNRFRKRLRTLSNRSIPACAGEPR